MMDCATVSSLVDLWEAKGEFAGSRLGEVAEHLASCALCAARFGALLPLLERDSGFPESITMRGNAALVADLAPAVMSVIGRRHGQARRKALIRKPRLGLPLSPAAIALAAAAVFLAGLGLGIGLGRGGSTKDMPVQFVLDAPDASEVALVGNFNNWSAERNPMRRPEPGKPWEISLRLPKGRLYVYNFNVDGRLWITDPSAPEKVDDGFGGSSSLLRL